MPLRTESLTIAAEQAGRRLDHAVRHLTALSREQIAGLFDHFCVTVDGAVCTTPAERTREGCLIEVKYDTSRKYHPKRKPPRDLGFEIIFEDTHLIVVNKPPAILTVPSPYGERNTLIQKLTHYLKTENSRGEAFVAHRLDRGVSGLLVFGKSLAVSHLLRDQFELRKPQREYIAIVRGTLASYEGTFRSYLATDGNLNRYSTDDHEAGQLAVTHYRIIHALHDATLVQVWLETGRRNQIRVHFAEAGHPVLGDPRYRTDLAVHPQWTWKRIALHARSLGFTHPVTGETYRFEAELPAEFQTFLTAGPGRRSRGKG